MMINAFRLLAGTFALATSVFVAEASGAELKVLSAGAMRAALLDPLGDNEVHKTVKSRGNQPRLNKLVEILVKARPRRAESASCRNVFWQLKV